MTINSMLRSLAPPDSYLHLSRMNTNNQTFHDGCAEDEGPISMLPTIRSMQLSSWEPIPVQYACHAFDSYFSAI